MAKVQSKKTTDEVSRDAQAGLPKPKGPTAPAVRYVELLKKTGQRDRGSLHAITDTTLTDVWIEKGHAKEITEAEYANKALGLKGDTITK